MKHEEHIYFKLSLRLNTINPVNHYKFTVLYTTKMKVIISPIFGKNKVITIYIMSGLGAKHRKQ